MDKVLILNSFVFLTAASKIGAAPAFVKTIQPISGASAGQLIRLDAKITGSPPIEVQWLRDGEEVVPDITHKTFKENDVYTLLILEATAVDRGVYDCVATNTAGEARCRTTVDFEPLRVSMRSYASSRATSMQAVKPLVTGEQAVTQSATIWQPTSKFLNFFIGCRDLLLYMSFAWQTFKKIHIILIPSLHSCWR